MSSYYLYYEEELIRIGMQPGEIAIYTGAVLDGLYGGPSAYSNPSSTYVYWLENGDIQELDSQFQDNVLEVSIHEEHYVFLRSGSKNFIRQISGPAKPVIMGNIGAEAIRVDTPLGKFLVPAGTVLRLDRDAPLQREKKKVLLTFSDEAGRENYLKSALILEGERWRPLNACASGDLVKIKDGAFTVQTLTVNSHGRFGIDVTLNDPPDCPDYELYLRSTSAWLKVCFAGVGMKDEGLTRVHHTFSMKRNEIYDFQRLRQTPATELMGQCTARLPGLEELDDRSGNGQGETAPADRPALRELPDPSPGDADTPDIWM